MPISNGRPRLTSERSFDNIVGLAETRMFQNLLHISYNLSVVCKAEAFLQDEQSIGTFDGTEESELIQDSREFARCDVGAAIRTFFVTRSVILKIVGIHFGSSSVYFIAWYWLWWDLRSQSRKLSQVKSRTRIIKWVAAKFSLLAFVAFDRFRFPSFVPDLLHIFIWSGTVVLRIYLLFPCLTCCTFVPLRAPARNRHQEITWISLGTQAMIRGASTIKRRLFSSDALKDIDTIERQNSMGGTTYSVPYTSASHAASFYIRVVRKRHRVTCNYYRSYIILPLPFS